ncbi:MAG: murein biosynthesis integral membrane protein MurJ [Nitratireductor sp.]|nr:murein biosynthesis integral membrane protein MurJ [Nitratireductor sp.]
MGLIAKFSTVGGATLASRILGFAREALIASALGAGPVADAFYAAFRFPNLFRRLFAEGAFNSAFVPLFAKELEGGGREAARRFAEEVLAVLLVVLIAISAIAMIFMPVLVETVIASRFDPASEKFSMTVVMAQVMFPYLTAMSLVAMLSGILNSFRRYFLAALAPVLLNVVLIGVLLIARQYGFSGKVTGMALAYGVVGSGFLQLGLLVYGVWKEGFPLGMRLPKLTSPVKRLLWLAIPAAITGGITQINLLVGQNIASAQDGAIAVMNYADRLVQLPLGVIGIAIGVVLLPELARALKAGDLGDATHLQNRSLEFGLGLTLPAAVGFMIMPEVLVAIVYERGSFARETTELAGSVLAAFAIGLPAFTLISIFRPGFYAREDMRTPMWFAGANAFTNIAGSLVMFPVLGVAGIALATSIAGWVNAILLGATLWSRNLFRPSPETFRRLGLIVLANIILAAGLWLAHNQFQAMLLDGTVPVRIGLLLFVLVSSVVIYFGFVVATGAIEGDRLAAMLRKRKANPEPPPGQ